ELAAGYRELAGALTRSGAGASEVRFDTEVERLPADRAVALLGWENRFRAEALAALSGQEVALDAGGIRLGRTELPRAGHTVVLTARHPQNPEQALAWIAADPAGALPGLARKLPHYHKYSYLGFAGEEPANVAKGRWPVLASPLTVFLPGPDGKPARAELGKLARRLPLAELPPVFSEARMLSDARYLASAELAGRGFGEPGAERAAEHIAEQFRQSGLEPAGDVPGSYFQQWEAKGGDPERSVRLRNVVGVLPGSEPKLAGQSVVVGAHYDHLGRGWPGGRREDLGQVHFGADDNASGVAVLLELARVLAPGPPPERSIVFAAFAGEEAGRLGSRHYVTAMKRFPAAKAIGMLNLDTVGRLGKGKLFVLGGASAMEWPHIFRGAGFLTGVEIEMAVMEIAASDQASFHEAGVPAVQLFSGPHLDYHRPTDTAEKLDPAGLARVAAVAKEAVEYLAGRPEPLTSALAGGSASAAPRAPGARKVSFGIVPDFAFKGEGVRLAGTAPGSPAAKAGLREGDVLVRLGGDVVVDLRGFSGILERLAPGQKVEAVYRRDGEERRVEVELEAR
ncbi:MAG TPA: M20/M25/M40 family metallo-hydrolase, partial [Desulfuromonadales bacterium]|nr:M20/M25/M40 family metallo-hydrolase [Desulfuromonadales bacterium]